MNWRVVLATPLALSVPVVWSEVYYQDRIENARVGEVDLSDKTVPEAVELLQQASVTPPQVTVNIASQQYTVSASELGWKTDPQKTAEAAFTLSKQQSYVTRLENRIANPALLEVSMVSTVDPEILQAKLQTWAKPVLQPAKNAEAVFQKNKYIVKPELTGLSPDIAGAVTLYTQDPSLTKLDMPTVPLHPEITTAEMTTLVNKANALLRPIKVISKTPTGKVISGVLPVNTVADLFWVRSELVLDDKGLSRAVQKTKTMLDKPAQNASYRMKDNHLIKVPEQAGYALDPKVLATALAAAVLTEGKSEISVPTVIKTPSITLTDLPEVGKLQLISSSTSYFAGSSAERAYNVANAARLLDGAVVGTGEVFSFLGRIGEISERTGFKGALIISDGRTTEGIGGGVCQVSTTAFRSMYKAGFPVVERNQHSYRVRWYEPYPGFEAAVYDPGVDLKMKNDTSGPILIRATVDNRRGSLTVNVFGTPVQRKVVVSEPVILSRTPHPPAQTIVDATLRPGQSKQVDWAVDGFKVQVFRTITDAAGKKQEDVLHTNYKPWKAVYLVGPSVAAKTTPKPVQPKPTPTAAQPVNPNPSP